MAYFFQYTEQSSRTFFQIMLLIFGFSLFTHLNLNAQYIVNEYGPDGDGIYKLSLGSTQEYFYDAVIHNGKIIAVGTTDYDEDEGSSYRAIVVRLNPNGTPDPTFNNGNPVLIDFPNSSDRAYAVAVQPGDGKIIVAGTSSTGYYATLFRLNNNGTLDNSFGPGGKAVFNASVSEFYDVAVLPSGKIVACGLGFLDSKFATLVARFNANGTLDITFNQTGYNIFKVGISSGDEDEGAGEALAVQQDGKIVVTGYTEYGAEDVAYIARLTTTGVLDASMSTGGEKLFFVSGATTSKQYSHDVLIDGSGQIVAGGDVLVSGENDMFVARFYPNGNPDNSCSDYGFNVFPGSTSSSYEYGNALAIQADGKLLLAGRLSLHTGLIRINKNCLKDSGFGNNGVFLVPVGSSSEAEAIVLGGNEIILVGGFTPVSGSTSDRDGFIAKIGNTSVVSTYEEAFGISVKLLPNPASDVLHLELTGTDEIKNFSCAIFDLTGRSFTTMQEVIAGEQTEISVNDLPPGTYFLTLYANGATLRSYPFVVSY